MRKVIGKPDIGGLTDPLVGLPNDDWEFTLTTLRDAGLVSLNRAEGTGELLSLYAHPLIREYFAMPSKSTPMSECRRCVPRSGLRKLSLTTHCPPVSHRLFRPVSERCRSNFCRVSSGDCSRIRECCVQNRHTVQN